MDKKLNICTFSTNSRSGEYPQRGEAPIARWEWWLGDSTDPAEDLMDFLGNFGLPVHNVTTLSTKGNEDPSTQVTEYAAALLISAAAAAAISGAMSGKPSPAPQVPDIAAIVYSHELGEFRAYSRAQKRETRPTREGGGTGLVVGEWQASWSPHDHREAITAVQRAIAAGDVYQVNLVGHHSVVYTGNPAAALRAVATLPGARYAQIITGAEWAVASASPELLVRVTNGGILTRPIKGTRPYTPQGRQELIHSPKERAEHVMIVDLMRNDCAQLAEIGGVTVNDLFTLRPWCDLWQAESTVQAWLRDQISLGDVLRALAPGGSVTGAPKQAALRLISELEPVGRGPAMGAVGWLTPHYLELGLTIRTVAATPDRFHLWTGGGITWPSEPDAEVAEAAAKAAPIMAAIATTAATAAEKP